MKALLPPAWADRASGPLRSDQRSKARRFEPIPRTGFKVDGRHDQAVIRANANALCLLGSRVVRLVFRIRDRSLADLGRRHAQRCSAAARRSRLRRVYCSPAGKRCNDGRDRRHRRPRCCSYARRHTCCRQHQCAGDTERQPSAQRSERGSRRLVLDICFTRSWFAHSRASRTPAALRSQRAFASLSAPLSRRPAAGNPMRRRRATNRGNARCRPVGPARRR